MDRKYRQKLLVFIWLFLITILLLALAFYQQEVNSNQAIVIIRLGNPLVADGKTERALNVWDLQVFNGKIYVAGGSSVEMQD